MCVRVLCVCVCVCVCENVRVSHDLSLLPRKHNVHVLTQVAALCLQLDRLKDKHLGKESYDWNKGRNK